MSSADIGYKAFETNKTPSGYQPPSYVPDDLKNKANVGYRARDYYDDFDDEYESDPRFGHPLKVPIIYDDSDDEMYIVKRRNPFKPISTNFGFRSFGNDSDSKIVLSIVGAIVIIVVVLYIYIKYFFKKNNGVAYQTLGPISNAIPIINNNDNTNNGINNGYQRNDDSGLMLTQDDINALSNPLPGDKKNGFDEYSPFDDFQVNKRARDIMQLIGLDSLVLEKGFDMGGMPLNSESHLAENYVDKLSHVLFPDDNGTFVIADNSGDAYNKFGAGRNVIYGAGSSYETENPPISISQNLVAMALCPSDKYDLDIYITGGVAKCKEKCPVGFETLWFEPKDKDGKPMTRTVQVTDENGNIVYVTDEHGKSVPKTRQEPILPESWCRAMCPPKLKSANASKWDSRSLPSSDFMNSDAKVSYTSGGLIERTDTGDGTSYCSSSFYEQDLQRGGDNIVCGWCTESVGSNENNGTSTNRHNCDSSGQRYHIDFTPWCMRRRLSVNISVQDIDPNAKQENNSNIPFCASLNGQQSRRKYSKLMQGPKACRNGDLKPILPSAYLHGQNFKGTKASEALVSTDFLVKEGTRKFKKNEIAFTVNGVNWSNFLNACYSKCPVWMIPWGPIESHQCREACPPNTYVPIGLGQPDMCKKVAFIKKTKIPDMTAACKELTNQIIESRKS